MELNVTTTESDKLRRTWKETQWRQNGPARQGNQGDRIRVNRYGFSELSSGMSEAKADKLFKALQPHVKLVRDIKGVPNDNITPDSKLFYTQGDNFWKHWFKNLPRALSNDKPSNIAKFLQFDEPIVIAHSIQRLCQGFACTLENYETFKAMGFDVHNPISKDGKPVRHRYFAGGVCFHHLLAKVTRQHQPRADKNGNLPPYEGAQRIELFYVNSDHLDMFIRPNNRKNGFDMTPDKDVFPDRWLKLREGMVLSRTPSRSKRHGFVETTNLHERKGSKKQASTKDRVRSRANFKRKKETSLEAHKSAFTVRQLRDMCKKHDLKVSGRKDELIVRLDKAGKL